MHDDKNSLDFPKVFYEFDIGRKNNNTVSLRCVLDTRRSAGKMIFFFLHAVYLVYFVFQDGFYTSKSNIREKFVAFTAPRWVTRWVLAWPAVDKLRKYPNTKPTILNIIGNTKKTAVYSLVSQRKFTSDFSKLHSFDSKFARNKCKSQIGTRVRECIHNSILTIIVFTVKRFVESSRPIKYCAWYYLDH